MRRAHTSGRSRPRLLAPLLRLARASSFSRQARAAIALIRRSLRRMLRHAGRQPSHLRRVLRRFRSRQQAQRADKTETEHS